MKIIVRAVRVCFVRRIWWVRVLQASYQHQLVEVGSETSWLLLYCTLTRQGKKFECLRLRRLWSYCLDWPGVESAVVYWEPWVVFFTFGQRQLFSEFGGILFFILVLTCNVHISCTHSWRRPELRPHRFDPHVGLVWLCFPGSSGLSLLYWSALCPRCVVYTFYAHITSSLVWLTVAVQSFHSHSGYLRHIVQLCLEKMHKHSTK